MDSGNDIFAYMDTSRSYFVPIRETLPYWGLVGNMGIYSLIPYYPPASYLEDEEWRNGEENGKN